MCGYDWVAQFQHCYDKAVDQYRRGNRETILYLTPRECAFLASIGCTVQELYDFAEDYCTDGAPSFGDALRITSVRRYFFLTIQKGQASGRTIPLADLPAKDAAAYGIKWLPRIIAKARAKLRGELPPEIMYGCRGDRRFLQNLNIHPADFLRHVWSAGDDDQKIIAYIQQQAAGSSAATL